MHQLTEHEIAEIRGVLRAAVLYGEKLSSNIDWCLANSTHAVEEDDDMRETYLKNLAETLATIPEFLKNCPERTLYVDFKDEESESHFDDLDVLRITIESKHEIISRLKE